MNSAELSELELGQLDLGIQRVCEPDRNSDQGGRSFYFFDLDDNIMNLPTRLILFHRETNEEHLISTHEFSHYQDSIGRLGRFADFEIRLCEKSGSFRNFRDHENRQIFLEDMAMALERPNFQWQGPSWCCFYHATLNQRPIALITARGHGPETLSAGFAHLHKIEKIAHVPNWLGIYPISHAPTQKHLKQGRDIDLSPAQFKRLALRESVQKAFRVYGYNPHHRFGVSDDDGNNIENLYQELIHLKHEFPKNSFFLIETQGGHFIKREIGLQKLGPALDFAFEQMSLF